MVTLETSLKDLYHRGLVTFDDALSKTSRPEDFKRLLLGASGAKK
jgi:Tfp pilus assembly pilus retraction ATPase PilT